MPEQINKFSHLWNDLPKSERHRLMPHMIEAQKLHILQCRQKAINAHKKHIKELDAWIASLNRELK